MNITFLYTFDKSTQVICLKHIDLKIFLEILTLIITVQRLRMLKLN